MAQAPFPILYEDNHLLVINKPAQLATMGVRPPRKSALEMARNYIKEKYQKPGNVYLGVVSRLDAPATGILVFARTSKAAARLTAHRLRQAPNHFATLWSTGGRRHQSMNMRGAQH